MQDFFPEDTIMNMEHFPHSKRDCEWRYNDIAMSSGVIRFLANKHAANKYMVAFNVGDRDVSALVDELNLYTWSVSRGHVFSMSPYYFKGTYVALGNVLRRHGVDSKTIRVMMLPQEYER